MINDILRDIEKTTDYLFKENYIGIIGVVVLIIVLIYVSIKVF